VIPKAQDHVARLLSLSDARQVAFAPNTHDSWRASTRASMPRGPLRVLTTASEFHSFRRQTRRVAGNRAAGGRGDRRLAGETFDARFAQAARGGSWDLVWLSHVFFDSRLRGARPGGDLRRCARRRDGVHRRLPRLLRPAGRSFARAPARVLSRRRLQVRDVGRRRLLPRRSARQRDARPADTGWFASFDTLSSAPGAAVPYAKDAFRFWGATFDPTGLYRFNAAMDWLASTGASIDDVHLHSVRLQKHFLDGLLRHGIAALAPHHLVPPAGAPRGNFLAFDVDDAEGIHRRITAQNVVIDRRRSAAAVRVRGLP
jgi:selenocysteine lyase/cysteine desulfurase